MRLKQIHSTVFFFGHVCGVGVYVSDTLTVKQQNIEIFVLALIHEQPATHMLLFCMLRVSTVHLETTSKQHI